MNRMLDNIIHSCGPRRTRPVELVRAARAVLQLEKEETRTEREKVEAG